ncbi:MAG: tRNA (adenosine(37)-N6)-threonylcarbamoyltransferase complex ATPase subunit type 1 TsaE [Hellea sp.]|nr:tRNA (adenosine(37)-N6)-threonylcarbamoyltransferase complex ATPase subunit type 1 TsaE [Hellea sp.]
MHMQMNRRIDNEADMLAFGVSLARLFRAGDTVALTGDLGAGKTTLARGIIRELCGNIEVPSPTYTLIQTYDGPEFEIWHCDLYRLERPEEVHELGLIDVIDEALCLIEWPDRAGSLLPETALTLNIAFEDEGRLVKLTGDERWELRLENV